MRTWKSRSATTSCGEFISEQPDRMSKNVKVSSSLMFPKLWSSAFRPCHRSLGALGDSPEIKSSNCRGPLTPFFHYRQILFERIAITVTSSPRSTWV